MRVSRVVGYARRATEYGSKGAGVAAGSRRGRRRGLLRLIPAVILFGALLPTPVALAASFSIHGTITDTTGAPVVGASVRVCTAPNIYGCSTPRTTNASGVYSTGFSYTVPPNAPPPTAFAVTVTPAPGAPQLSAKANVAPTNTDPVDFVLRLAGYIHVTVTDPDGLPAPSTITMCEMFVDGSSSCGPTDQTAEFTFRVDPDRTSLPGFLPRLTLGAYDRFHEYGAILRNDIVPVAGETIDVAMQFQPGHVMTGVVANSTGPIVGGYINYGGPIAICPPYCAGTQGPQVQTDAGGAYTIHQLPGGPQLIFVAGPTNGVDYVIVDINGITLCNIDASISNGGCQSVSGVITDPSGAVVAGATVALDGSPGVPTAISDGSGRYFFPGEAVTDGGTYSLTVTPPVAQPDLATTSGAAFVAAFGAPMVHGVVLGYADADGIDASIEDAGPNGGDGNNDGVLDSQQANVASLPNAVNGQYVTLVSAAGTALQAVSAFTAPATPAAPSGVSFPHGLVDFDVRLPTPGASTAVTLLVPAAPAPSAYFKFHDGAWLDATSLATFGTGSVTLALTDGGVGDDDDLANGVIVDPGGPAIVVTDGDGPVISITSPAAGSAFTLGQAAIAAYSCSDASAIASCAGPVSPGAAIDTIGAGHKTFTVLASDTYGNTSTASTDYDVLAGNVTAIVTGGESITTDPGSLGASPDVPVQTRVGVPSGVAGTLTVTPQASGAASAGTTLFPHSVSIAGPGASSPSSPYQLTFDVDGSDIGTTRLADLRTVRGAAVVPSCTGAAGVATPDPCVAAKSTDGTGDVRVSVLSTQLGLWSFGRPSFAIDAVTPGARPQAASHQLLTLSGGGFLTGATAKFSGTGITVHSVSVTSPTTITLDVTVAAGATVGARDLTLTNPGKVTAVCAGCFTVNAKPAVTSVAPSSHPVGASHRSVDITGSGFQAGAVASVAGGGVTVHSAAFVDPTRITIDVSIDAGAALGSRTMTVTNPDGGVATKSNAIVITAQPAVNSLTPTNIRQGRVTSVAIAGSGFASTFATGGTVSFGVDVTVQSVVRNSATKLTASVLVSPTAAIGPRDVTVTNPDGGIATCVGCGRVVADPQIGSIAPASRAQGVSHQIVSIVGSGFASGATAKFSGAGITVHSAVVTDASNLVLDISVGAGAATGARDFTVTNVDTGTTTCTGCFAVTAKPTVGTLSPSTAARSLTTAVVASGTGFQPGSTVTFSGTGVSATVQSSTSTTLTLSVTVQGGAAVGQRSVTVNNPDGGTVTKGSALRIV